MTRRGTLLEARELVKDYGSGRRAVDRVSFGLTAGESLGIVGESGSGKSTTARLLTALERPDAGEVRLDGASLPLGSARRPRLARARAIQMVFQDPYLSLDPRLQVGHALDETVRLHTTLDRRSRARRVDELLAQVGLAEAARDALPSALSGGQRQRVAIARALAVSPRILVLDEAVSALDVSVQAQILNLLHEIRRDTGVAYVFISHDLAVVQQVTDRVIVMWRGRVVEAGDTAQVLSAPQHAYTRMLLASVPRPSWDPASVIDIRRELEAAET